MSAAANGKSKAETQLERLARLLLLETGVREAEDEVELGYLVVNDTLSLVSGHTAVLWRNYDGNPGGKGELFAVSAAPLPDRNAPFTVWVAKFCRHCRQAYDNEVAAVADENLPAELRREREEHVARHALWLPLRQRGRELGALVIWRARAWSEAEVRILRQWAGTVGHAWYALRWSGPGPLQLLLARFRSRIAAGAAVLVLALMFVPVRLSVLAPAEVVSSETTVVRSPLQGVIQSLHAASNSRVEQGEPLLSLDDRSLKTELEVAQQELEVARAEYRQTSQAAAYDEEAKARLQSLRITLEKYVAEVNYLSELLGRTRITAEKGGIAIIENPDEMLGRPVQLGERLMAIVDESKPELAIWLPVGDDIELAPGAEVNFFPNVAPAEVFRGEVLNMDYQAQTSPLGTLAYRMEAGLDAAAPDAFVRVGMRGTAKVHGRRVTLFYYLFRRPISWLRQTLGL